MSPTSNPQMGYTCNAGMDAFEYLASRKRLKDTNIRSVERGDAKNLVRKLGRRERNGGRKKCNGLRL